MNSPISLHLLALLALSGGPLTAATLDTHTVVLDGGGQLLSWVTPQDQAYGRVATLSANFIKAAMLGPVDSANGRPAIYTHSEYHPTSFSGSSWANNPAGKHAMLADSMMLFYAYSGDTNVLNAARSLLDFQLRPTRGTTPTNYHWANVPWSTAAAGNTNYGTDSAREGTGILEPDKIGELGFHGYLRFYQITGNTNYRNAAIACADALASHVRTGSAAQSPWPFRVNAQTGALGSTPEDYCADVVAPIRLFDELIRLGLGNTNAYAIARATAWNWLMTYPVTNNKWANYFEDDAPEANNTYNVNQYNAGQTARYLLERPELDPSWRAHASNIIAWIETTFGGTDMGEAGLQYGARVISEQLVYKYKMASHTGRYAAINALFAERTGDAVAKAKAFRSLNWCSYMARTTGSVIEGPYEFAANPYNWFTDGHGDYIRHFMLAMGAFPEWAPANENHLLRSSSVVQFISYTSNNITYRTFDNAATEVFRLALVPSGVLAGGAPLPLLGSLTNAGWTYDAAAGVLRVRHDTTNQIQVQLGVTNSPPGVSLSTPANDATFAAPALITLTAALTADAGTVTNVEFFSGITRIGEDSTSPYNLVWPNVPIGSYTLTARTTDHHGVSQTSVPVSVSVTAPVGGATMGNLSEGTTTDFITDDTGTYINANRFQAQTNASVTMMRAKLDAITGRYQCAIYSDSGGSASRLLRATATLTNVSGGWHTFPLTSALMLTNGLYYWLAIWSDDVDARVYALPGGSLRFAAYPFGPWPDPVSLSSRSNVLTYCIYATSPAPTAFEQWKSNYGLPANTPSSSDANGNGLPLIIEYTLGLDPLAGSSGALPLGLLEDGFLTLTYTRIKAATDIAAVAEVSFNSTGSWSSGTAEVDQFWHVLDGLTFQTITARDNLSVSNTPSRFMRLSVTGP